MKQNRLIIYPVYKIYNTYILTVHFVFIQMQARIANCLELLSASAENHPKLRQVSLIIALIFTLNFSFLFYLEARAFTTTPTFYKHSVDMVDPR